MSAAAPLLEGKRVLVVEDETLVAMLIEDFLLEYGCSIIGPCGSVDSALKTARTEMFDVAILDVNLRGDKVYPVAEALTERNIPFLFLSGYGDEAIPRDRVSWKVCPKPFRANELMQMLSSVLTSAVH